MSKFKFEIDESRAVKWAELLKRERRKAQETVEVLVKEIKQMDAEIMLLTNSIEQRQKAAVEVSNSSVSRKRSVRGNPQDGNLWARTSVPETYNSSLSIREKVLYALSVLKTAKKEEIAKKLEEFEPEFFNPIKALNEARQHLSKFKSVGIVTEVGKSPRGFTVYKIKESHLQKVA